MFGANLQTIPPGVDGHAALRELQKRVSGKDGPIPGSKEEKISYLRSEHTLVRFLIARQWNVEKAATMLREHYRWLSEVQMEKLLLDPFPEENHIKTYYPQTFHGTDKKGRPIYIERPGLIDMRRLLQHITPERLLHYFFASTERQVRRRLPACSLVRGEVVDKSLNIMDLHGLGFSMVTHTTARKVLREVVQMLQNHYPECSGQMIIINAPKVFSIAWSFVKPMLDDKTVSKIQIYGTDKEAYREVLLKLVDRDQLPALYGGSCKCDGVHEDSCIKMTKGPWTDPEILEILEINPLEYIMTPEGSKLLLQKRAKEAEKKAMKKEEDAVSKTNQIPEPIAMDSEKVARIIEAATEDSHVATIEVASTTAESIDADTIATDTVAPPEVVEEIVVTTESPMPSKSENGGKGACARGDVAKEDIITNGEGTKVTLPESVVAAREENPQELEEPDKIVPLKLEEAKDHELVPQKLEEDKDHELVPQKVEEDKDHKLVPQTLEEETRETHKEEAVTFHQEQSTEAAKVEQEASSEMAVESATAPIGQGKEVESCTKSASNDDESRVVVQSSLSVVFDADEKDEICHKDSFFSLGDETPRKDSSPQISDASPRKSEKSASPTPGHATLPYVDEEEEFSAEELQDAELEVQCLLEEISQQEEMHMLSLMAWVKESNTLTRDIGRDVIERAQAFYDCEGLLKQTVADYYELQQKVERIDCELEKARSNLSLAETALEAFMQGKNDLTEEEWTRLAPLPSSDLLVCSTTTDKKLLRSLRVSSLSDSLVCLQCQREETIATRESKGPEMEQNKIRFDEAQSQHWNCTWNCSVKRAEPFYRKRQAHEDLVVAQLSMLESTEKRLQKALKHFALLQEKQLPESRQDAKRGGGGRMDTMKLEIAGAEPFEEEFMECDSIATSSAVTTTLIP